MRLLTLILLGLCCGQCNRYRENDRNVLSTRLDQIKKLSHYDDKVVGGIDSVEYNDMSFPYWNLIDAFYRGDIARFKYCQYVASQDNVGQRPDTSKVSWRLTNGPHPYLYLRDTARVEDLKVIIRYTPLC